MRLCKDCEFAIPAEQEKDWICDHISALWKRQSPITGEMQSDRLTCQLWRSAGDCGREGKFWQARKPAGFV